MLTALLYVTVFWYMHVVLQCPVTLGHCSIHLKALQCHCTWNIFVNCKADLRFVPGCKLLD